MRDNKRARSVRFEIREAGGGKSADANRCRDTGALSSFASRSVNVGGRKCYSSLRSFASRNTPVDTPLR